MTSFQNGRQGIMSSMSARLRSPMIVYKGASLERHNAAVQHHKRVLIVLHQMTSCPGAVGQWLISRGYRLDIRRPRFGDLLPVTLEAYEGVIVFGGPMSVNDSDDYIRYEIEWMKIPLKENKPLLGICLGAQMLACHLGGRVSRHPDQHVETGYVPVTPTDLGGAFIPWPSHFYQFHNEGIALPSGVTHLASSALFENQAYRFGDHAFGFQFHPEATLAIIHRWTICGAARLNHDGALNRKAHLEDHLSHGVKIRQWLDLFMSRWITGPQTVL